MTCYECILTIKRSKQRGLNWTNNTSGSYEFFCRLVAVVVVTIAALCPQIFYTPRLFFLYFERLRSPGYGYLLIVLTFVTPTRQPDQGRSHLFSLLQRQKIFQLVDSKLEQWHLKKKMDDGAKRFIRYLYAPKRIPFSLPVPAVVVAFNVVVDLSCSLYLKSFYICVHVDRHDVLPVSCNPAGTDLLTMLTMAEQRHHPFPLLGVGWHAGPRSVENKTNRCTEFAVVSLWSRPMTTRKSL